MKDVSAIAIIQKHPLHVISEETKTLLIEGIETASVRDIASVLLGRKNREELPPKGQRIVDKIISFKEKAGLNPTPEELAPEYSI